MILLEYIKFNSNKIDKLQSRAIAKINCCQFEVVLVSNIL